MPGAVRLADLFVIQDSGLTPQGTPYSDICRAEDYHTRHAQC